MGKSWAIVLSVKTPTLRAFWFAKSMPTSCAVVIREVGSVTVLSDKSVRRGVRTRVTPSPKRRLLAATSKA